MEHGFACQNGSSQPLALSCISVNFGGRRLGRRAGSRRRWVGWRRHVPPGRCVAARAGRAADRRGEPRRGAGPAVDARSPCSTRARPACSGGRDELSGGTWLAVNEDGVCAGLTNQPLGDLKDPTKRSRGELPLAAARCADGGGGGRDAWAGLRPGATTTAPGCWWATGRRCTSWTSPARRWRWRSCRRGSTCSRTAPSTNPRPRSTSCAPWSARPSRATRMVEAFGSVLRRPPGPRRGRAAECGDVRASRHVRDAVLVPRARGGRRACRPGCGWPTGRRARWRTRTLGGSGTPEGRADRGREEAWVRAERLRLCAGRAASEAQLRTSGLYLMRCGWSASTPRRLWRSAS